MGLYEGIKDVAKVVQQADNIELYRQLLDLSVQALDLQAENGQLKEELHELKKKQDLEDKIIRHGALFLQLKDQPEEFMYCTHCWDSEKNIIQLRCDSDGEFYCPHCHTSGIYDENKYNQRQQAMLKAMEPETW